MDIENKLLLQKEYSKNMEQIVDAVRKERHDFNNHISTLLAICTMPGSEQLTESELMHRS